MSDQPQQSSEGGAPEWMVSYADMITIMMAFFVVLYASTGSSGTKDKGGKSGEEAKGGKEAGAAGKEAGGAGKEAGAGKDAAEARLEKVFDSLYYRFGPEWTFTNCWVGGPAALRNLSQAKANREEGSKRGGKSTRGPGRQDYVVLVTPKPNENIIAGGRIYFDETSTILTEEQIKQLRTVADNLAGKLQKIEIRGHTGRRPLPPNSPYRDHWDLAYTRCRSVEQCLVSQGIDPRRIRLGVAGQNEPFDINGDPLKIKQNSRVEIHVLNEWVKEPTATQEERAEANASAGKE